MDYDALARGIDLSHWNSVIDWPAVKTSGVQFAYIKATQAGKADPTYAENAAGAESQDILWMPYAFVTIDDRAATVASFIKMVGKDKVAVLDWEAQGAPASVVDTWIDGLTKAGIRVLVYYGVDPPSEPSPKITACPRILPEYANDPRLPAWDGKSVPSDWSKCWLIWQRSDSSKNAAVVGSVDLDVLAIDFDRFKNWCDTGDFLIPDPSQPSDPQSWYSRPLMLVEPPMTGDDVADAQRLLGVPVDGVFGRRTRLAVVAFQRLHGLPADGVVGPATAATLGAPR